MEGLKVLKSTQIVILGICFVIATIASTIIFSKGLLQIKKFSGEVISVTGSAEKEIESDYIVWNSSFSRREHGRADLAERLRLRTNVAQAGRGRLPSGGQAAQGPGGRGSPGAERVE